MTFGYQDIIEVVKNEVTPLVEGTTNGREEERLQGDAFIPSMCGCR